MLLSGVRTFRKKRDLNRRSCSFEKFAGREILFTCGTRAEGGEMELTNEEYVGILKDIQSIYHPDYIDFEYYSHREVFEDMLEFSNLVLSATITSKKLRKI